MDLKQCSVIWMPLVLMIVISVVQTSGQEDVTASGGPKWPKNIQWAATKKPNVGTFPSEDVEKEPRLYELTNEFNLYCLRAVIKANIYITYKARNKDGTIRISNRLLTLPKKPLVDGSCAPTVSTLKMTWNAGYVLFFKFETQGSTWVASEIQFMVDTHYLEDAITSGIVEASNNNETQFFETSITKSFECDYALNIPLELFSKEVVTSVNLDITKIKVQPFGVPQQDFSAPNSCAPSLTQVMKQNQSTVIVAAILGTLIIVIIIGYIIYRNRTSGNYKDIEGGVFNRVRDFSSSAYGHVRDASHNVAGRVKTVYESYRKPKETDLKQAEQPSYASFKTDDPVDLEKMTIIDNNELHAGYNQPSELPAEQPSNDDAA